MSASPRSRPARASRGSRTHTRCTEESCPLDRPPVCCAAALRLPPVLKRGSEDLPPAAIPARFLRREIPGPHQHPNVPLAVAGHLRRLGDRQEKRVAHAAFLLVILCAFLAGVSDTLSKKIEAASRMIKASDRRSTFAMAASWSRISFSIGKVILVIVVVWFFVGFFLWIFSFPGGFGGSFNGFG
mgnify:CR=1 FL=1